MISLLSDLPIFHGPRVDALQKEFGMPPDIQEAYQQMQQALAHNYAKTKDILWKHAMILANGGTMPTDDEVREKAQQVVTKQGVTHLLWDHPLINPGDYVDMSYCIASIDNPV